MAILIPILLVVSGLSQFCQPYGIRLFLGHYYSFLKNSQDVIRVVFNTQSECRDQFILHLSDNKDNIQILSLIINYESQLLNMTKIYEDNKTTHFQYETWIHTFKIGFRNINLDQATEYNYSIYDKQNSKLAGPYTLDIPKTKQDQKILIFGDMDSNWVKNYSQPTFDWLENEVKQNSKYDAILFTGDMAYDLESKNCMQGDYWLRNISKFTSRYPFMAAPGNHDWGNNTKFEFFRANFGTLYLREYDTDKYLNDFISFDVGYAHIIQFNPIKIVYNNDPNNITPLIVEQMRNDLIRANQNRDNIPWIIVYSHYPIYCSSQADQCLNNYKYLQAFENLFLEFKVDLYLSGHQHNYQRNKPYYQNKKAQYEMRDENVIFNYNYPISIIEGVGGTDYGEQNQTFETKPFMEFQNPDHGVGVLTIKNKTHLYFEHITVSDNKVIDSIWIEKQIIQGSQGNSRLEISIWVILVVLGIVFGTIYCKYKQNKKNQTQCIPLVVK